MRKRRREVFYVVACDCPRCLKETGGSPIYLSCYWHTKKEAFQDVSRYSDQHPSCYVAHMTVNPVPERTHNKLVAH